MAITRQEPVKDFDTDETLNMPGPTDRITRGILKRILFKYGVDYPKESTRDDLFEIMRLKGVPFDPPPPGPIEGANGMIRPTIPNQMGPLRKMCKDYGIKTLPTDKKDDLIAKLEADIGENTTEWRQ